MEQISIRELVDLFGSGGAVILLVAWLWFKDYRTRRNGKTEPSRSDFIQVNKDIHAEIKALNINLQETSRTATETNKRTEDIWEKVK